MASTSGIPAATARCFTRRKADFSGTRTSLCRLAGVAQAAALGERLGTEPIEAVYASDLLRAQQSAAPLAAARGTSVVTVPTLREMAMGRWEGLTFAEIRAREPRSLRPVAGRSLCDAVSRGRGPGRAARACRARLPAGRRAPWRPAHRRHRARGDQPRDPRRRPGIAARQHLSPRPRTTPPGV